MWGTIFLLYYGNIVLGIIEGLIVGRMLRVPYTPSIALLILANYVSAFVGSVMFGLGEAPSPLPESLFEIPLHHPSLITWICVLVAFGASLLIEWPACLLLAESSPRRIRSSLLAATVAQVATYSLLALYFAGGSNTIGREVVVSPLEEVVSGGVDARVYFIDPVNGDLCSFRLDGSDRQTLRALGSTHRNDVLGWWPPEFTGEEHWRLEFWSAAKRETMVVLEHPPGVCEAFRSRYDDDIVWDGWWLGFNGVADLRAPENREIVAKPSGNSGVSFRAPDGDDSIFVSYDTPFVSWWGRCITLLPDDLAVFELGQQVCVLSLETRKIAFLARGRGPCVLLGDSE